MILLGLTLGGEWGVGWLGRRRGRGQDCLRVQWWWWCQGNGGKKGEEGGVDFDV